MTAETRTMAPREAIIFFMYATMMRAKALPKVCLIPEGSSMPPTESPNAFPSTAMLNRRE
jgi:hypothetical protein